MAGALFHTLREWAKYPRIFHGFGTKYFGEGRVFKKDWFGQALKIDGQEYPLVAIRQVHGDRVVIFEGQDPQYFWREEGDALLTKTPGFALAVFTADCFPALIIDPLKEVVGIVHIGWSGTAKGILLKTLIKMQEVFNCQLKEIQIALGPGICPGCLEVDEPVKEAFDGAKINWPDISIPQREGKWSLDLEKANMLALKEWGIREEHIFRIKACPSCEKNDYHSYRGEGGNCGRMLNFIGLKNPKDV